MTLKLHKLLNELLLNCFVEILFDYGCFNPITEDQFTRYAGKVSERPNIEVDC